MPISNAAENNEPSQPARSGTDIPLSPNRRVPAFFPGNKLAGAVFLFLAGVYWWERSRGPGWGDSLGFLLSALQGFKWSVNATGHFLYDNLNAALTGLLPGADPIALLTGVSLVFAVLTVVRIGQTSLALTGNRLAALLTAVAFGMSFTFWRQAEQVEVYTCAAFFTASALHAMFRDTASGRYGHTVEAGIWFGLALLVHIQTMLLLPLYLLYLLGARMSGLNPWRIGLSLGASGMMFLLLLVPAGLLPEYTAGSVFFSFGFRDEVFHFDIRSVLTGFAVSLAYLAYSFHIHLVAMAAGFIAAARSSRSVFVLALAGIIPVWLFAMRYPVSDQYVFFLNAYLLLSIFCAFGYQALTARIASRAAAVALLAAALAASPAIYTVSRASASRVPQLQSFHEQKAYKGGLAYYLWPGLRKIPEFTDAYERQEETGERPDHIESELWERLRMQAGEYYRLRSGRN